MHAICLEDGSGAHISKLNMAGVHTILMKATVDGNNPVQHVKGVRCLSSPWCMPWRSMRSKLEIKKACGHPRDLQRSGANGSGGIERPTSLKGGCQKGCTNDSILRFWRIDGSWMILNDLTLSWHLGTWLSMSRWIQGVDGYRMVQVLAPFFPPGPSSSLQPWHQVGNHTREVCEPYWQQWGIYARNGENWFVSLDGWSWGEWLCLLLFAGHGERRGAGFVWVGQFISLCVFKDPQRFCDGKRTPPLPPLHPRGALRASCVAWWNEEMRSILVGSGEKTCGNHRNS